MSQASPKLLLVANASAAADVSSALVESGFPEPDLGLGGDETLELFSRCKPDVVLLVTGLTQGDLPSLSELIRSGRHGRPAPIVLIADVDASGGPADAAEVLYDHFVARPVDPKKLASAVMQGGADATGVRIDAAMDLAIETFVADAMDSLSIGLAETAKASERAPSPREKTAVLPDKSLMPAAKWREPTQVLDEPAAPIDRLDQASRKLLNEVLPGETLDVDIEELDGVKGVEADEAGPLAEHEEDDDAGASEPNGGDFARQLRRKMSAMAARLFPGQGAGDSEVIPISSPNTAHTEIDLGSIAEGNPDEGTERDSYPLGDSTHGLSGESDVTRALDSSPGRTSPVQSLPGGQALVGQIDVHGNDIAAVMSRFWRSEFSGSVVLRREEVEKRIQFDKGRVVFASSATSEDRMGELLVRSGKINPEQLEDCRAQVSESGRRMGEVLVDMGYLKPRELLPAVRQHLEDIFYSVFAWTTGSYDALPEQAIEERIRLSRHSAALIVEGVRRKYDVQRLESCLGGMGTIVLAGSSETLSAVVGATDLSSAENAAQRLFDGEHTLEDIAKTCELDRLRVAQLAYAWVCLGVAEIVEHRTEEGAERGKAASTHLVGETDLEIDRKRVLAKYRLVQEADYFQLLGVRSDASAFEIRRAYETAQRYFKPESFPVELQEELSALLDEIGQILDEAYLVLRDDQIRSSYRAHLP